MKKIWPRLYKKTSTGAIQTWVILVNGATIRTSHGQDEGKVQEAVDVIRAGKNVGRSNETTPEEQAALEAQARWEKKVKAGYVEDFERADRREADVEGGILPMLAKSFSKDGAKIKFPAFAQPKLDGGRCIAVLRGGEVSLWTRTRKRITSVPHIVRALEPIAAGLDPGEELILDGELYNHDYRDKFEEIMSLIRPSEPRPGHEVVQYHVYDAAIPRHGFATRHDMLTATLDDVNASGGPIVLVLTVEVEDEAALMTVFEDFRDAGYEGAMVRNAEGAYGFGKRSADLQKIKEFEDAEFEVVDVEEGRGKLAGHVGAFVCLAKNGERYRAKMAGETEALRRLFEGPRKAWLGKSLTVKYQGLTGANGVPRFPVGLRFRDAGI